MKREELDQPSITTQHNPPSISSGAAPEGPTGREPAKAPEPVEAKVAKPAQEGPRATFAALKPPSLELPRGGGAMKSIGESFRTNPVTGTVSASIPLPITPAPRGPSPQLGLSYDSGSGNGPFGHGWSGGVAQISRRTDKGVPEYLDVEDSDTFLFGGEELVPLFSDAGVRHRDTTTSVTHVIERYRPRIEGAFSIIERWTDKDTAEVHWRVHGADNSRSTFGASEDSRIADHRDASRVSSWLIDEMRDDRGHVVQYLYKPEDRDNIPVSRVSEAHRDAQTMFSNRYLKRVRYGNTTPDDAATFKLELVFDYGEHDDETPTPSEPVTWPSREDPFSSYRTGFEIRTYRLCRRVLMFHHFAELGSTPQLVRSVDLTYAPSKKLTQLVSAKVVGYDRAPEATEYTRQESPAVTFEYTEATFTKKIERLAKDEGHDFDPNALGRFVQFADLDGEGIPGLVTTRMRAIQYKPNEGEGHLGDARRLPSQPNLTSLIASGGAQLMDVAGSGTMALVRHKMPAPGYHERTGDGWGPFRTFSQAPNVNWDDPNLRMVDLDGDGFQDIMVLKGDHLVYYPSLGRDGFGPPRRVPIPRDPAKGPHVLFTNRAVGVFLADMTGDGLSDIVRVTHSRVSYWPNMGHGRFGAEVIMDRSPSLAAPHVFNPVQLRLADLDGTGTADIVYFDKDGMHAWMNEAGNGFADAPLTNECIPVPMALRTLQITDLHGSGMSTFVWAPTRPPGEILWHTSPFGTDKPYLLASMKNGMGLEVRFQYASSTKFYLADKNAGKPWATKLPMPVQVVERVESYDAVSRTRLVSTTKYRNGFYDTVEREFRGFGMVETSDTESFAPGLGRGLFGDMPIAENEHEEEELYQPPVLTKTWFHTGAWIDDAQSLEDAFAEERWTGDSAAPEPLRCTLPTGLKAVEVREAYRALKGTMLRQEVYGLDGSLAEDKPYVVSETNYQVKRLQPQKPSNGAERPKLHAVFQLLPVESREHTYDRVANDPRVTQWAALQYDTSYGFVTRDISVAYARRSARVTDAETNDPELQDLDSPPLDEQRTVSAIVSETTITHAVEVATGYRLAIPVESKTYEIIGLEGSAPLSVAALAEAYADTEIPASGFTKQLIDHVKVRYYDSPRLADYPDPSDLLGFGSVDARAIAYESYRLDLTDALLDELEIDDKITSTILTEGGYVTPTGASGYWIPSGRATIDGTRFFIARVAADPFGNETSITYDDYDLLVEQIQDELGNVVTSENDYRLLAPRLVTDPNENSVAADFDELGRVIAVALMGKDGASEGDTLEDPTHEFEYVTDQWSSVSKPNYVHTKARKEHGGTASWQETYAYSDGSGRVAMTKIQAEPGDAPELDENGDVVLDLEGNIVFEHADPRWVGTGRTVLNNKGNPIKQYEPYFSSTHAFETDENLVNWGVTPVIHYDAIGRVVRTDFPDGSYSKSVHGVWRTETWDQNDTLDDEDNEWRKARETLSTSDPERTAFDRAFAHKATPSRAYIDPLGRAFLAIAHNIDDTPANEFIATRTILDVEGQPLTVKDPLERPCQTHAFSIAGQLLKESNIDKGARVMVATVLGEPLRRWDDRNQVFRTEFDDLRRPTRLFLKVGTADEVLLERRYYGDDASITSPEDDNLKGKLVALYDGAGLVELGAYDFKGNLLASARTLWGDHTVTPDWIDIETEASAATAKSTVSADLEGETFIETRAYDALNRITSVTAPDDSEFIPTYNEASLLEAVNVKIRGATSAATFVKNVDYDAKGQRTRIEYSKDPISEEATFVTEYGYDELTFRLKQLVTTKASNDAILQDLRYTFDPVGNIVRISDGAQQSLFYADEFVAPVNQFVYDAIYRLISATGREHTSVGDVQVDNNDQPIRALPLPSDTTAMRNYEEAYQYDKIGNLIQMLHDAASGAATWTRGYTYNTGTNRLATTTVPAPVNSVSYTPDAHGNMVVMPHLAAIDYTPFDQMMHADLGGGGDAYYSYDAGGTRIRKIIDTGANLIKERIYLGGFEIYREHVSGSVWFERETLHVMDGVKRMAMVETKTREGGSDVTTIVSRMRFQLANHLGSAMLEVDEEGLVISYEEYHPYGTSAYRSAAGSVEVSARRYRYNGKERDDETGLYYYGARYYAAWLGRWTSADPLGIGADGPGVYNYVRGSPVTLTDPNGLETPKPEAVQAEIQNLARIEAEKQRWAEEEAAQSAERTEVARNTRLYSREQLASDTSSIPGAAAEQSFWWRYANPVAEELEQTRGSGVVKELVSEPTKVPAVIEFIEKLVNSNNPLGPKLLSNSWRAAENLKAADAATSHGAGEEAMGRFDVNLVKIGLDLAPLGMLRGAKAGGGAVDDAVQLGSRLRRSATARAPGERITLDTPLGPASAVEVSGRLSPSHMASLQASTGKEWSLIYVTGPGKNGGGGTYWLIEGFPGGSPVPIGPDVRWIMHTHPERSATTGARVPLEASPEDQAAMRLLRKAGSPQQRSQIVPETGRPFYFTEQKDRVR